MNWLKEKIKKWLLKDEIQKMNEARNYYYKACDLCEQSLQNNKEMHKMYNEITDIAVDVGTLKEEHSWAVICIAGRPEYIRFIPLKDRHDAKMIIDFLKQFQYSKYIVDSPMGFRDMISDYLYENS